MKQLLFVLISCVLAGCQSIPEIPSTSATETHTGTLAKVALAENGFSSTPFFDDYDQLRMLPLQPFSIPIFYDDRPSPLRPLPKIRKISIPVPDPDKAPMQQYQQAWMSYLQSSQPGVAPTFNPSKIDLIK